MPLKLQVKVLSAEDLIQRYCLITARIRSMTGRYFFHRCLSVNISGGGYPVQVWMLGGVPHLRSGDTPSRSGWLGGGNPISGLGGELPHPGLDGGGGYPIQVWMVGDTPSQVWGGGYPIPGGYPSQVWMVGGTPS